MARLDLLIEKDPDDIVGRLLEVYESTKNFQFNTISPHLAAQEFVKQHPMYSSVPRSFIRGSLFKGKPVTDSPRSFSVKEDEMRVWGMGKIGLKDIPYFKRPIRYEFAEDRIIVHLTTRRQRRPQFRPYDDRQGSDMHSLRRRDDIVDYLLTNGISPGKDFWRKHAILSYFRDNPDITREELNRMGLTCSEQRGGNSADEGGGTLSLMAEADWNLLADFLPQMQSLLRAVSKPRDDSDIMNGEPDKKSDPTINILSVRWSGQGQFQQRKKKELRLPNVLDNEDNSNQDLSGQSFEKQIYKSLNEKGSDFFH